MPKAPSSPHQSTPPMFETLEKRVFLNAGQLDLTFAQNGLFQLPLEPRSATITDLFVMPDGRFLITGTSEGSRITVMRFRPDGTPDSTFGDNGRVVSTLTGSPQALAVTVLENGQPVVAGTRTNQYFILKYRTNGTHDKSFGAGGLVSRNFQFNRSVARDIEVLGNGQLIVAGEATSPAATTAVALARHNPNGSLDTSFGTNGETVTKFSLPMQSSATFDVTRMAVALDGKLVVSGRFYSGFGTEDTADSLAVMRFTANGQPDTTFRGDGLAMRELAAFGEIATGVVVDSLNRPIVSIGGADVLGAVRFNEIGQRDDSFGLQGAAILSREFRDTTTDVALQDGGDIVLSGQVNFLPRIARMDMDGVGDIEFGFNGIADPVNFGQDGSIERIKQAPDGTIIAAGAGGRLDVFNTRRLSISRYFTDDGPAGLFFPRDLRAPRIASHVFQVEWRDRQGVDVDTLRSGNLVVTGPGGFVRNAALVSFDDSLGAGRVLTTYKVAPPGDSWDAADNGVYTIEVRRNQVADLDGNFAVSRVLGVFRVNIQ